MPQSQTQSQSPINGVPQGDYQAVDPRKDPIAFVFQNKEALGRMDPDKAVKFVDMLFRRVALPKYQKVNQQRPLDEEELEGLRLQFAARMFGIPYEQKTKLKDPEVKHGTLAKAGALAAGAGAGVIGGLRSIEELREKIQKSLGPIGKIAQYDPVNIAMKKAMTPAGKVEGRAFEEAKTVSPGGADVAAGIGHQIPAAIATAGVGSILPGAAKTAPLAGRVIAGGAKGALEGGTFEASRPGGDSASGAQWGGVLGAAFPMLGKMFGLGRKAVSSTAPEAAKAVGSATAEGATAKAASYGDIADIAAKKKFGKAFKDLTSPEKTQMPEAMKEEIKAQQAVKQANAKAAKAAAKAGREAEETAKRAEKAKTASAKAASQAAKRSEAGLSSKAQATLDAEANSRFGKEYKSLTSDEKRQVIQGLKKVSVVGSTTPVQKQAVAAKAAEENPSIAKTLGSVEKRVSEGKSPTGTERRAGPLSDIKGPDPIRDARISELRNLAKTGTAEEKAYAESALKDMREHPFESGATLGEDIRKARAKEGSKPITKLSPEETGPKIRAKEGKPASPAQQAADRERIAAKRELSKKEEFGSALEKHAQELAGKHTSGSLGMMQIPELEETMKEFPNGDLFLKGFQKMRKQGKITDEIYAHEMIDWLKGQFEAQQ